MIVKIEIMILMLNLFFPNVEIFNSNSLIKKLLKKTNPSNPKIISTQNWILNFDINKEGIFST